MVVFERDFAGPLKADRERGPGRILPEMTVKMGAPDHHLVARPCSFPRCGEKRPFTASGGNAYSPALPGGGGKGIAGFVHL